MYNYYTDKRNFIIYYKVCSQRAVEFCNKCFFYLKFITYFSVAHDIRLQLSLIPCSLVSSKPNS